MHYCRAADLLPEDCRSVSHAASCYSLRDDAASERKWQMEGLRRIERELHSRPENVDALAFGAVLLAQLADSERTDAWVRCAALLNDGNAMVPYNIAYCFALSGRIDESLEHLTTVTVDTPQTLVRWISHDSDLASLRETPRYRAFVAKLEAESETRQARNLR